MATRTITVTCKRCGKRHEHQYDARVDKMEPRNRDSLFNTFKKFKPLCRDCKKKAS